MVQRRKKKSVKLRGSKTHGYGSMKKHRGAGHRGGRGNAGSGKRADSKKPSFWKDRPNAKAHHKGFFSITGVEKNTINVGHLSSIADRLVLERKAVVTQGAVVINLRELGIDKLLGGGKVYQKMKVSVGTAAPAAKEKLEAIGGSLDAEIVDKTQVKADRDARAKERKLKGSKEKVAKPAAE